MRSRSGLLILSAVVACGGAQTASPSPRPAPTPPASSQLPAPEGAATAASSSSASAYDDPSDDGTVHDLVPLFTAKSLPSFPAATVSEADCAKGEIAIVGDARKDYETMAERCGAATGAAEYAHPVSGRLHSSLDKRDTYRVNLSGGLCYRFIGVADGSIQNLDMVIRHGNGDVIGQDRTAGPVAILLADKAWCIDDASDFVFDVEVNGEGTGHYVFGVWARPKS